VLAVGGVAYDPPEGKPSAAPYRSLPGSADEVKQLRLLAGGRVLTPLTGADATASRLLAELPRARYAHLATHGFFDEAGLSAENRERKKQLDKLRASYEFKKGRVTGRAGLGARNPLAYTGLVLAGANHPDTPDHGIVTGLALVDLPLEGLRLAVLSACDTGLGELTGGEGVQGLVRAFHLAGCPDVVASLWQVDDRATTALMAKFYHELWVNKKPPIEALRLAQLTVYRHPELIPDLAGERGSPGRLKEVAAQPVRPAQPGPADRGKGRAPAKLWAAFVLSGTGQ
jgi:CHAT domain-containing protein